MIEGPNRLWVSFSFENLTTFSSICYWNDIEFWKQKQFPYAINETNGLNMFCFVYFIRSILISEFVTKYRCKNYYWFCCSLSKMATKNPSVRSISGLAYKHFLPICLYLGLPKFFHFSAKSNGFTNFQSVSEHNSSARWITYKCFIWRCLKSGNFCSHTLEWKVKITCSFSSTLIEHVEYTSFLAFGKFFSAKTSILDCNVANWNNLSSLLEDSPKILNRFVIPEPEQGGSSKMYSAFEYSLGSAKCEKRQIGILR